MEKYLFWDDSTDNLTGKELEGNDLLLWEQTGRRHYPNYYRNLSTTKVCACYGGVFAISWGNYNKYTAKIARKMNDFIKISQWDRVRQWDSWRLWEAWAAGCCVIHIDLEKYSCKLPVMPENGVHYIGVDINDLSGFEKHIENDLASIAENGKSFVLAHYSPIPIAKRLLEIINIEI